MRLPDFLIVGGMKCGSTTLYRDLMTNPAVFFPIDKEPENLATDEVLTDAGRRAYARLFEDARPDQRCAEASTAYTKLPDVGGVPARARALLGSELRVIYIVREPISRIRSHHHHEHVRGNMPADIDRAVREVSALLEYTRYATQAEAWIDALGPGRVRVLRLEDFTTDRVGTVTELCRFLEIEPRPDLVEADRVYNRGEGKPVLRGPWRALTHNPLYRRVLRPLLPVHMKDRIRASVLPKAPPKPPPPSAETEAWIREQLAEELERLPRVTGNPSLVWPEAGAAGAA